MAPMTGADDPTTTARPAGAGGRLRAWAAARGYAVAWGPLAAVAAAREEIRRRHAGGELDDGFFRSGLAALAAAEPQRAGAAVVAVARPEPARRVGFRLPGRVVEAILPPTYVRYRETFEEVRQDLAAHALPGVRVEHLSWPHKAAAARLGLVRYGRNNLAYAGALGSWVQLCAYVTDADLGAAGAAAIGEPRLLDECAACSACTEACPTGAIGWDRVLLRAERCLTHVNEGPGQWPDWVPERAHHCLIGCLACQRACPANPPLPVVDSGVVFSEEETDALLAEGPPGGSAGAGIRVKLAFLGLTSYEPAVLGRNLRALSAAPGADRE